MEPITHALSGAVIGCALPGKRRWWLPAWAALVAASPDMDVFFTRTPLQYIEYHRGITHSFVGGLGSLSSLPHPLADEPLAGPQSPRRLSAIRLAADAGMARGLPAHSASHFFWTA